MPRYFGTPFALNGDRTVTPNSLQTDGSVSFEEGFGFDYERPAIDPNTGQPDPLYKPVPRDGTNGLFHDITEALGQIQKNGFGDWTADAAPYPYMAFVRHNDAVWFSVVAGNSAAPGGAGWLKAPLNAFPSAVATGAANAYLATFVPALPSPPDDGQNITIKIPAGATNTGASTLNGVSIVGLNNSALTGNELAANGIAHLTFRTGADASMNRWVLRSCSGASLQIANAVNDQHAITQGQAKALIDQRLIEVPFVKRWQTSVLLTAASGSFPVPAGVSRLRFYVRGAGAPGQPGGTAGGDGGSGGGCAWGEIIVAQGQSIAYTISSSLTRFGAYAEASAGVGRAAPGMGSITSGLVENSGTASGGQGGVGRNVVGTTNPSGGGGGGASGSPLGSGGQGGSATAVNGVAGGGGSWGGDGSTQGFGGGTGGNAGSLSPASSASPGSSTPNAYGQLPGRTQFTRYVDPLLSPCNGSLVFGDVATIVGTALDASTEPGCGGKHGMPGGYGGGAGDCVRAANGFKVVTQGGHGCGGGGGAGNSAAANCVDGGPAGYGGGGGGGGGTFQAGTPSTTIGGSGGPGCIEIFY